MEPEEQPPGAPDSNPENRPKARKINKIPIRKRFKHKKRHVVKLSSSSADVGAASGSTGLNPDDTPSCTSTVPGTTVRTDRMETEVENFEICPSPCSSLIDHDYASVSSYSRPSSSLSHLSCSDDKGSRPSSSLSGFDATTPSMSVLQYEDTTLSDGSSGLLSPPSNPPISENEPAVDTTTFCSAPHLLPEWLLNVRNNLLYMLPKQFVPLVDNNGIHVVMLGRRESKAVQRQLFVASNGSVRMEVHGKEYPAHNVLKGVIDQKQLSEENLGHFTDRIVQIISNIRLLEICAGMEKVELKEAWSVTPNGIVDSDTFKECRYRETFRSNTCELLVASKTWRCEECTKLQPFLKRKLEALKQEKPHDCTNIRYLMNKQKDERLAKKQKLIKKQALTIDRLQARMKDLIGKQGVKIDQNLSNNITEILQSSDLSATQSLFLQQQLKAISCKKSCGMRWHPTLIRLALSIYLKSPSAYKTLCDSGFMKLPSSRTLYDYSHAARTEQGIDSFVLKTISKQVAREELDRVQYHVLMADEIHVSKNLVIQKSTGDIIGFTSLDEFDKEIKILDTYLEDQDKEIEPDVATKILAYMVRGVSSKVKDVVASYPVCNPSPNQMYLWTWEVIGALERSGVKVIAFTCDGAPANRAFIKLHKPVTITKSNVIFDTINKFAPHRHLFFFSDVPHLLKTIRNALHNSRLGKKGVRCLKKNGEPIVWDTIYRLYFSKKNMNLKKSYKLTAQTVFLDGYSKMKVSLAAAVISKTVANDIVSQQWPRTTEIIEFISKTNDWFDNLNGAFSYHGKKTNNMRLNGYSVTDLQNYENKVPGNRFQELLDYVDYLHDWTEEIALKKQQAAEMSLLHDIGVQTLQDDGSFHALEESCNEGSAGEDEIVDSRCLLPHQTLLGIEMSTRAFIKAVSFLIGEGVANVNARVFCQDPLEQNFGKQRMGGGGSTNPNVAQFLFKQRSISMIGQLAASKRMSGNTEILEEGSEISSEPLPKRRATKNDINL